MGIFRFIFTCITQAIKIAIGIGITIGLFFAMGYLIDMFAAKKTAPPTDPRLKPYADRGMPLTGTAQKEKDQGDSLYLSFFETLLDKKPDVMPEMPQVPEKTAASAEQQKAETRPMAAAKSAPQPAQDSKSAPAVMALSAAAQRVKEIRAQLAAGQQRTAAQTEPAAESESVAYTLQVGSFQNNEVASSFSSSLAAKGYDSKVIKIDMPDKGTVYRVRMGKYKTLEEAQKAAADLEKKAGISAFITSK